MSYQAIRAEFEENTHLALLRAGVASGSVYFDNVQETPGNPAETFAVVALSFNEIAMETVGCALESIKGSLIVNIYSPKAEGSGKGEAIAAEVLKDWAALNRSIALSPNRCRVQALEGPKTINPDKRPHHCHNIACSFRAIAA